jgi:Tol biopolymer transport system component
MRSAQRMLLTLCALALVVMLCGCGGSGGVSGPSVDTAGKPVKPPPTPPPDTASKIAYKASGHVWTMNTDGTGKTELQPGGGSIAWSPDGSEILYTAAVMTPDNTTTSCLFAMGPDGGSPRQITFPEKYPSDHPYLPDEYTSDRMADWSPDGSYIAFVRGGAGSNLPYLCLVSSSGGTVTTLVDLLTEPPFPALYWPAWSPNGAYIAYHRDYQPPGTHDLRSLLRVLPMSGITPAGSSIDVLLDARYAGWSNDGTKLAFARRDAPGIWWAPFSAGSVNMAGAVQVTTNSADWKPTWSPDDTEIAFGNGDVYRVPATGGNPVNLTKTRKVTEDTADWSPEVFGED